MNTSKTLFVVLGLCILAFGVWIGMLYLEAGALQK